MERRRALVSKDLFVKGQEHLALKQQNIKAFVAARFASEERKRVCVHV